MSAARQQLATLSLTVQDLEARLKQGQTVYGGSHSPSGTPIAGWKVIAISGERAWLKMPKGNAITVTAGERLKVLGTVRAVDPRRRIGWTAAMLVSWWPGSERFKFCLSVVLRPEESRKFVLLPRRWVVERTFGWLNYFAKPLSTPN